MFEKASSHEYDPPADVPGSAPALASVFRPIQYLGSKLRTLPDLLSSSSGLYRPGDRVYDLFSGSSVVSQAFALHGAKVTAVDAQLFCKHLAGALLGEGRNSGETCSSEAAQIAAKLSRMKLPGDLQAVVSREATLLSAGPSEQLAHFYITLPQAWRNAHDATWLRSASERQGQSGYNNVAIISSFYAGTYFGLFQSLCLDFIRNEIFRLKLEENLPKWKEMALLSGLYSAMSKAVCSAGKHFAQPLGKLANSNVKFYHTRLFQDRKIDVISAFLSACDSIDKAPSARKQGNFSIAAPVDRIFASFKEERPALIYADPPYTAQQYSRFYHVLEVVAKYEVPVLQMQSGRITSGLYNEGRFKSDFSSKTKSTNAFTALVQGSKAAGASLVLSYSESSELSNGNARMISLPRLIEMCEMAYTKKKVTVARFSHSYRQFNAADNSNLHRDDPEILVLCEA
ncbi:DNA adenine methylase [Caballeronia sp. INML2]|uniref:DNA adenine methylase n=1 Tax=Caballeronia sp. INML2 TaxID=2921748 RepID=UPI002028785B|nr:DNA adenine methylase [Caballeronia sp. INML2]